MGFEVFIISSKDFKGISILFCNWDERLQVRLLPFDKKKVVDTFFDFGKSRGEAKDESIFEFLLIDSLARFGRFPVQLDDFLFLNKSSGKRIDRFVLFDFRRGKFCIALANFELGMTKLED